MNITELSLKRNRLTLMVLASIILMGLSMYSKLSRDSMPPMTIRVASIISEFPGASPERVELLVTDKLEKAAQELPELKDVSSTSRTGLSVVNVTLKDEVSASKMQGVWDRLRRKIEDLRELPDNVHPNLKDDGIGDVYGIVVGLTSDGFSYAELKEYADDIKDSFIRLDEAAKVTLGGLQEERIFVEFDNSKLKEYHLTANKLSNIIASTNILSTGGQVNVGDERIILEPTGNFNSILDIQEMLIPVGNNSSQLVKLSDITSIKQGYIDPPKQIVKIDGKAAVTIHINLKENANIIELGKKVNTLVNEWQGQLPIGLELRRVSSMDVYIDAKINNFVINLIQSVSIVLAVMLIFLGIRTGLIIASLVPIVIIMTLMIMGFIDVGLNQVTLAALIMALGMLVDNAIVVAETIMVKMEQGIKAKQAAISASSDLFMPLLVSTLTTSAAFLAFYLSPNQMGDIVGSIFVVITISLLSSWIIALTVITLFSVYLLKVQVKGEKKLGFIDRIIKKLKFYYEKAILFVLHYKKTAVVLVFLLFILAMYSFRFVSFVFFPDSDRNLITVDVNLPAGTKIETTEKVVAGLENYFHKELLNKGIVDWSTYIGKGPESYDMGYVQDEANSSYAHILINTSSFAINKQMIEKIDSYAFSTFANAEIKVSPLGAGGGGVPIEIKVSGESPNKLAEIAETIKIKLSQITGTKNIKDDWGPKSKKFLIEIDQNRAQIAGISSQDVATSLKTVLDGFDIGEYREEDKSIPIIMRNDYSGHQTLASLETLNIYAQTSGKSVPLLQIAEIIPQWQYSKIKRLNLKRTIIIGSELRTNGNAAKIINEIIPFIQQQSQEVWPKGYVYELGGDAKRSADSMQSVINYLPISGFIILILLIIQFNSVRKTIMVISTIPLALIGVVIGLISFQEPFGFMPFLGVISLAGIVINNAIVLIDRMEIEQNELKRSEKDAIIAACLQRFRPILLATFTTVFGMIPLYLSGGEMWEGMAVSIMVGLLFGTIITLVFIPALYSILYKLNYHNYKFNRS